MQGLLKKARRDSKSKSLDDLRTNKVWAPLTNVQKLVLANILSKRDKMAQSQIGPSADDNCSASSCHAPVKLSYPQTVSSHQPYHPLMKSHSSMDAFSVQKMAMMCNKPKELKESKSTKRFNKIFEPIIGANKLHACFSCALYQGSLAHGQLFITSKWLCFHASLIGKSKTVIIEVSKIIKITTCKTVKLIPNAIKISSEDETYVFSSFMARDKVYKCLIDVWQQFDESPLESDMSDVDSVTQMIPSDLCRKEVKQTPVETDNSSGACTPLECATDAEAENNICIEFFAGSSTRDHNFVDGSEETNMPKDSVSDFHDSIHRVPENRQVMSKIDCLKYAFVWCFEKLLLEVKNPSLAISLITLGTIALAVMSVYIGMRIILLEQFQANNEIARFVKLHDSMRQYQVDPFQKLHLQLLTQLTEVLEQMQSFFNEIKTFCHLRKAI